MRHAIKALVLAFVLTLAMAGNTWAKEKIVLGELSWDGAIAIEHVLKVIMESKLDVDVEIINAESAVIFAAMDKGNGSLDVYTDLWMPNQSEKWAKFIDGKKSVLVNDTPYTGIQGLFIPGYMQDKYGIKSVEDLKSKKIAKLFDSDGNGKGEYWPGGPGWGSTNVEQVKARSYGYDKYFEPFIVADSAFKAKLKADYRKKKGILFYYWTPEWIHAEYDLRRLEEPAFDGYAMPAKKNDPKYKADGCWNMLQPDDDPDWLHKSKVNCAWTDASIYIAYSKSLLTRAPQVARFLKQVALDPVVVNSWILAIGQEKRLPEEVASEWVKANPAIVNQWLNGIAM